MPPSSSHDPAPAPMPSTFGSRLSRRGFFGLTGGLLVAAACGSDDSSSGSSTTAPGSGGGTSPGGLAPGIVSNDMYATERPQRFAFALTDTDGFASGPPATIAFASGAADASTMDAPLNSEGLPEGRGLYVVEAQFPEAGVFDAVITVDGEELDPVPYQILEEATALTPGEAAPSVPSATVDDNRGVDPICTLDPPCPFHELDLATVAGAGKPVVIAFSTPARCTTRYCGPTLELLVELGPDFADSLDIIHVEIFRDPTTNQVAEPVDAYQLISEPWMYSVDGAGTITNRMGGAWDKGELRTFLESAAA